MSDPFPSPSYPTEWRTHMRQASWWVLYEAEGLRRRFTDLEGADGEFGYYLARRRSNWRTRHLWKSGEVTDKHYLAAGTRAFAEAFGTCEMLVIVGKDNLAVASANATLSQALIIVARVAVNAALALSAPPAKMMASATKDELSHARGPLLELS